MAGLRSERPSPHFPPQSPQRLPFYFPSIPQLPAISSRPPFSQRSPGGCSRGLLPGAPPSAAPSPAEAAQPLGPARAPPQRPGARAPGTSPAAAAAPPRPRPALSRGGEVGGEEEESALAEGSAGGRAEGSAGCSRPEGSGGGGGAAARGRLRRGGR